MNKGAVKCRVEDLNDFATAMLEAVGTPPQDARYMGEQIVHSNLAGHDSHGMRRLVEYLDRARDGFAHPGARPVIDIDRGALIRVDGNGGYGHILMREVTDLAIARARVHGITGVALHNSEAAGRLAPYCEQAAEQGIAVFMFVNVAGSTQAVAPPGGALPRLGTNPIAAGIPRQHPPHLVLDMATAIVAKGRIAAMQESGEAIPAEWVTAEGALRPAGGVKGFGLALVAEALAGALTQAGTVSAQPAPYLQGVFLIAIDVQHLRPLGDFAAEVDAFLDYVKDVPLEPGSGSVRIPGESTAANEATHRKTGIELPAEVWGTLVRVAGELGVQVPPTS